MKIFTLVFNRAVFFFFFFYENHLVGVFPSLGIRPLYLVSGYLPVSSGFCFHYQLNRQDLCRYHSIMALHIVLLDLSFSLPFCV